MTFELDDLPFESTSMGAWISEEGFLYHHGKHHAGYVAKLNVALDGADYGESSLVDVISRSRDLEDGVFNNAAQHYNHQFFWDELSVDKVDISERLDGKFVEDFGGYAEFVEAFTVTALQHFASGWAWLVADEDGKLLIRGYHDADTPADSSYTPLLCLDVWEHAYYIDHRNNRAEYIDGFFEHVDWKRVDALLG